MAMWAPIGCSKAAGLLFWYNRRPCRVRNTLTRNSHTISKFMTTHYTLEATNTQQIYSLLGEIAGNTKQYLKFL